MQAQAIEYDVDGVTLKSQLYVPLGSGKRPGILVFPEANGLGAYARGRAEQMAGLGYVTLACDYYGDGEEFHEMPVMMAKLGELQSAPDRHRARAAASLAALAARPEVDASRIVALGYCFGGTTALELARDGAALVGAVGFHSGLGSGKPAAPGDIKAKLLVCLGADDKLVPAEQRDGFVREMTAAKVDWQMHLYGGVVHAFTNKGADQMGDPSIGRYDAAADARSWEAMLDLFKEIF